MANLNFKVEEPLSYKERSKNSQTFNVLIALGIFALVSMLSDWEYRLVIAIFFFVVQYFKSSRWDRCFITDITLENQQVLIKYKEENQEKETSGDKNDFKFKKEIAFNRTKTIYLSVYFKGTLLLKQFEIGEWNEKKIDEVITAFKPF